MSDETIDLYLIQDPDVVFPDNDNTRGFNRELLRYYNNSIRIKNIWEFIFRLNVEVTVRRKLIKKLIIGSHGSGIPSGYGTFHIGSTLLNHEDDDINLLKRVAHLFVKEADVYIMACRTGYDQALLRKVSNALGGVRVHGYTDYITTTNYGLFVTLDDGTDDEGSEIVCLPGSCRVVRKPISVKLM